METASDRLKNARELRGYETATDAAKAFGWNVNTYRSHENGNRGYKQVDAKKYARALQVPVTWLLLGEGDISIKGLTQPIAPLRRVPVISFVSAGKMTEISDPYEVGSGDSLVSLDDSSDVGPNAFALYVKGDSMTSLTGISFEDGEVIVIDPDAPITPGCFVVARRDNEDEATFKKYRLSSIDQNGVENIDLVPLNPDHPTIHLNADNPGKIIGRVIRQIKKL